jgi:hypothetical protein
MCAAQYVFADPRSAVARRRAVIGRIMNNLLLPI